MRRRDGRAYDGAFFMQSVFEDSSKVEISVKNDILEMKTINSSKDPKSCSGTKG